MAFSPQLTIGTHSKKKGSTKNCWWDVDIPKYPGGVEIPGYPGGGDMAAQSGSG